MSLIKNNFMNIVDRYLNINQARQTTTWFSNGNRERDIKATSAAFQPGTNEIHEAEN